MNTLLHLSCLALIGYASVTHFGLLNGAAITAFVYVLRPIYLAVAK